MDVCAGVFGNREYTLNNLRFVDTIMEYEGYRFVIVEGASLIVLGVDINMHGEPYFTNELTIEENRKLRKELIELSKAFEFINVEFYNLNLVGWEYRLKRVDGFEHIDVYYLDVIDLLFWKIVRGTVKDIEDCAALVKYYEIGEEELTNKFNEWFSFYTSDDSCVRDSFNDVMRMVGYA